MTQITFGMTTGPNGPQLIPVFIPSSGNTSAPESYEAYFETPERVHIKVIFNTNNKAMADRYADELAQKSGWKVVEHFQEPEKPASLAEDIAASWAIAVASSFALCFALFMITMVIHFAGYLTYSEVSTAVMLIVRFGLFTVPIMGLALSGVALFTHSSTKKHG
jgi:hypothetical protein